MSSLLLHPTTEKLIRRIETHLPQALLLKGETGVGLLSIAKELAGKSLVSIIEPSRTDGSIDNENGSINVASIRDLYEQTRAKHTKKQTIIIDGADRMTHGAQNAFLKLLEEPNEHIHFILTAHVVDSLLPTIQSRVQATTILPITKEQTEEYLASLQVSDPKKKAQLLFIAAGLPAEIYRLSQDDEAFAARATAMGDARTLLQASTYEKLLLVQKYASSRDKTLRLIDSAITIARRTVSSHHEVKLIHQLERLLAARDAIAANHSIRLQLTQLVL